MPGPFEVTFFYKSWEDGGCDAWVGRDYNPRGQWFAVWHTGTPELVAGAPLDFPGVVLLAQRRRPAHATECGGAAALALSGRKPTRATA